MPKGVVIGIGAQSGQFTVKLIQELAAGRTRHGLVGVGVYDMNVTTEDRRGIRKQIKKLGRQVRDLTERPSGGDLNNTISDIQALVARVVRLKPEMIFLSIDASLMAVPACADLVGTLRSQTKATVLSLCFSDDTTQERPAYITEGTYLGPHPQANFPGPILNAVFFVRNDSPLRAHVGSHDRQNELVAKSLAAMWIGIQQGNYRPSLGEQVDLLRDQPSGAFIEMAISSAGLGEKPVGLKRLLTPLIGRSTRQITVDEAQRLVVALFDATMRNSSILDLTKDPASVKTNPPQPGDAAYLPMTTGRPLPTDAAITKRLPIVVDVIIPFRPGDPKFKHVADRIGQEIGGRLGFHYVKRMNVVYGQGVDLTGSEHEVFRERQGKFYCQVCVLFAIQQDQLSGDVNVPLVFPALQEGADA